MYLVVIAWLYVVLMMAVAEATNSNGTLLGAIITLWWSGGLPWGFVVYPRGPPPRTRALRAREAAEQAIYDAEQAALRSAAAASTVPDAGSEAPAAAESAGVASVRKEP
ncbi:MAG: hypothetical protein ACK40S_02555 [Burkholderiaceae bacterium]